MNLGALSHEFGKSNARLKDFSELFKTITDLMGLCFFLTEQSLIKKWRPIFLLKIFRGNVGLFFVL